ncbi:MAG: hypothetical protein ABSB23_20330 [Bryobacteraceae bacterium]|jgi:hypothetical protein
MILALSNTERNSKAGNEYEEALSLRYFTGIKTGAWFSVIEPIYA